MLKKITILLVITGLIHSSNATGGRYRFQIFKSKTPLNFLDAKDRCRGKHLQLAKKDELSEEDHVHVRQNLKKGTRYWFDDCFQLSTSGNFRPVNCDDDTDITNGYVCEPQSIELARFVSETGWPNFLDWQSVLLLARGESSWHGWLSAVTIVIYITWGIAGCLAIILLGYLVLDRFDTSDEHLSHGVEDVSINDNSFYNDLEQLGLEIDAYVDRSSKLINSKRSYFRKFQCTPITDTTYDLRLIKAMALQLSRINHLVGNKKDEFIQAVMDRIAEMELTELAGSQEIDVCELVTKLSQYLRRLNTQKRLKED